jgi:hypothetical protein
MRVDFSGKWHNQHASEMELTIGADGKVTGTYHTGVGSPRPAEVFALTGFVSEDLIVFTANFGKYESLTAWAGQHTTEEGVEKIYTMWHMAVNIEEAAEPKWLWYGMRSGSDVFLRGPHPTGESATRSAASHPLKSAGAR